MNNGERTIERDLIDKLESLGYTYRPDIRDWDTLRQNFREKFQELNETELTDAEFKRLMGDIITSDVHEASHMLREKQQFRRDDDTSLFYKLINTENWCQNTFEVVNQVRLTHANSHHEYDVVLLMNGIPVAQIELKNHSISTKRAMEQIVQYKNDDDSSYERTLMCFLQLFIISNGHDTWYFANNNQEHFNIKEEERFLPAYQFAASNNEKITDLHDFADIFLSKCALGETINRYMVILDSDSEKKLMVMRPYQIYAVKAIMDTIEQGVGNGYIWHTTGSGKTLTSFKASTLMKENDKVDKCIFVVDRKDLDRQTREEFNKFQKNCVEENTNTRSLVERLISRAHKDKVIVTTIQKLALALGQDYKHNRNYREELAELKDKRIVFIFDECHRSQFGENHKAIKNFFPEAQLFGFTGTPIFDENASYKEIEGNEAYHVTTKEIFQNCLHAYTITHAIEDENVLRFRVDYLQKATTDKDNKPSKKVIVKSILEHHDRVTANRKFNAFLATNRIKEAMEYYELFKTLQEEHKKDNPDFKSLNIACVFSPPHDGDKDIKQIQEDLPTEKQDNKHEPDVKRKALKDIISDYNNKYRTNHSIDEFDLYYQDLQLRIKAQKNSYSSLLVNTEKVDIVIVVDMLLTGFDSAYLNTLYVDKKLQHHGLIQAFSRTNRILNRSKPFGNILDFRQQEEKVEEAIELFAAEDKDRAKEIWLVEKPKALIEKFKQKKEELDQFLKGQNLQTKASEIPKLKGDANRANFVNMFREIQSTKVRLDQYTDLSSSDKKAIEEIFPEEEINSFKRAYLDTAKKLQTQDDWENSDITEEERPDFEMEIFKTVNIDYDYIMELIRRYLENKGRGREKMTKEQIIDLIAREPQFMNEKDDIEAFINSLKIDKGATGITTDKIKEEYQTYKAERKVGFLKEVASKHSIDLESLVNFFDESIRDRAIDDDKLSDLLEPLNLDWDVKDQAKIDIIKGLEALFHNYSGGKNIKNLDAYQ